MTKKTVEDTRPQWKIDRDQYIVDRNNAAGQLLDDQRDALKFIMKTLISADSMLHECYELSVEDMRSIDASEWKLRAWFPEIHEEVMAGMTCSRDE